MLIADTYLKVDPTWPFSEPWFGLPSLAGVAIILVTLTIWTYLGTRNITRGQLLSVLLLRLIALVVAALLVLRPALARQDDETLPSKLLVLVDSSESMNLTDDIDISRWDNARRILANPAVTEALKELALKHKIELVYYQGAEGIARFEPGGKATGKRTDFGVWLQDLGKIHHGEKGLRGLVIFSDGADNGTRFDALKQAAKWAGTCPISTFALGKENTSSSKHDVALVDIQPPPKPVPIKTQFSVKGRIHAFGFKGATADLSLWIENHDTGELVMSGRKERIELTKEQDNEVELVRDAPTRPGEYKITLKVDPLPGELTDINNQISSFITVTKEGVSILWVEGRKRLESSFALRYALNKDARFRLYPAEKLSEGEQGKEDFFKFGERHYDVIVIGDVSAGRFSSGNREVFRAIHDAVVKQGTGVLLLGGHESFANSDWNSGLADDLTSLLPVTLDVPGQVEKPVRMMPTKASASHYLLNLSDNPDKNRDLWEKLFEPLDGMTHLGTVKPSATVLATAFDPNEPSRTGGEPMLVYTQFGSRAPQGGSARVLVFAADTTWRAWRRTPETLAAYERFWKQTMLWLACQENAEGAAWIKLDKRRLSAGAGQRLEFNVGLHGKGGVELKKAQFKATVIGPESKDEGGRMKNEKKPDSSFILHPSSLDVPILSEGDGQRGYFSRTDTPGEYRVKVVAKGKDIDGTDIESTTNARFVIAAEDLEILHPAANHNFLRRLAHDGGGQFFIADEKKLLDYLHNLTVKIKRTRTGGDSWPDWRARPASVPGQGTAMIDQLKTLWKESVALPCLIVFVSCLSLEWYLRRRWDLV